MEEIIDSNADIALLTETWMTADDTVPLACFNDFNYNFYNIPRNNRQKSVGGGVGIAIRNSISYKNFHVRQFHSFECCATEIVNTKDSSILCVVIYRLGYIKKETFFSEIRELLEILIARKNRFIISGDFNIHIDVTSDPLAKQLNNLLSLFNLRQHVFGPTQRQGHTIDLVITPVNEVDLCSVTTKDVVLSDHRMIFFNINSITSKKI